MHDYHFGKVSESNFNWRRPRPCLAEPSDGRYPLAYHPCGRQYVGCSESTESCHGDGCEGDDGSARGEQAARFMAQLGNWRDHPSL